MAKCHKDRKARKRRRLRNDNHIHEQLKRCCGVSDVRKVYLAWRTLQQMLSAEAS